MSRNSFDDAVMITCDECKGTGMSDCTMEYGDMEHPENCPACGGEQKIVCPYCDGSGKIEDR